DEVDETLHELREQRKRHDAPWFAHYYTQGLAAHAVKLPVPIRAALHRGVVIHAGVNEALDALAHFPKRSAEKSLAGRTKKNVGVIADPFGEHAPRYHGKTGLEDVNITVFAHVRDFLWPFEITGQRTKLRLVGKRLNHPAQNIVSEKIGVIIH